MLSFQPRLAATLAASFLLALAQGQNTNGENGVNNATTPTTNEGEVTIHYITVGQTQNQFVPNSINAVPGDIVTFQFWPTNHSVIRAEYGYACIPYEDAVPEGKGFYSGPQPAASSLTASQLPTWNLTINDTAPVFFYCGAPGSCVGWGMVGAINADAEHSVVEQISLAKQANYPLDPGQTLQASASASLASLAATATALSTSTTSSSQSSTPTSTTLTPQSSSSGISTGAIAGIAVGGAAALVIAALLFWLLGRNKALKQALHRGSAPPPPTAMSGPESGSTAFNQPHYGPASYDQSRHNSMLPPYIQHSSEHKTPDVNGEFVDARTGSPPLPSSGYPTPRMPFRGFSYTGTPASTVDHDDFRFSQTSELDGGVASPMRSQNTSPAPVHEMPAWQRQV